MKYDRQKHHRRSIHLKGYDYTQTGAYFLTLCTWQRECLFGKIVNGEMQLSLYGEAVKYNWYYLNKRCSYVQLDAFTIMPDRVHGIIWLTDNDPTNTVDVGAGLEIASVWKTNISSEPAPTIYDNNGKSTFFKSTHPKRRSLPEIIQGFKTSSATRINQLRCMAGVPVWQRNYYEHIIRNEEFLQKIRVYVINNPSFWQQDE